MSAAVRTIFLTIAFVFFALNCWFLYYIDDLEKKGCNCAVSWRRSFIEFMLAVYVVMFIASLIFPIGKYMVGVLSILYFFLIVTYIIVTRQFIDSMTEANCTCASNSNAFWWLGFINNVNIVALFLTVLIALFVLLFYSRPSSAPSAAIKSRRRGRA